jgi:hypothetical protein
VVNPSGDYHLRMTQGTRSNALAVAAPQVSACLVLGAQPSHARGAASVRALAFALVPSAHACKPLYAMRGPLSRRQSLRKVRCGVPAWLALAPAASANRSMHTDVQVLPAASRPRLMGAGDFQR